MISREIEARVSPTDIHSIETRPKLRLVDFTFNALFSAATIDW